MWRTRGIVARIAPHTAAAEREDGTARQGPAGNICPTLPGDVSVVTRLRRRVCGHPSEATCLWSPVCGDVSVVTRLRRRVCGHPSEATCLWSPVCGDVSVVTRLWRRVCGHPSEATCLWSPV
ncbi:unnamed protein product [Gadus morhua 'NCC']